MADFADDSSRQKGGAPIFGAPVMAVRR